MNGDTTPKLTAEDAETILRQQLSGRILGLRVSIHEDRVILQGAAASYFVKQLAQHSAMKLFGLIRLVNEIEVRTAALGVDANHSDVP
jgi:osmotically-inducible protein OsmY